MGCIDFEHSGVKYSFKRTYTYKKGLNDSEKIAEDVVLNYMNEDHDWRRIDKQKETIEKMLPSGLSDYFFFDGESMIADLRVKGKDSASKLRKALYSMFDLDVLESTLNHIGRTDLRTTVLGKLYLSKGTISSGSKISAVKTNIENAQSLIEKHEKRLEKQRIKKQSITPLFRAFRNRLVDINPKQITNDCANNLKRNATLSLKAHWTRRLILVMMFSIFFRNYLFLRLFLTRRRKYS